jgi:hypothetical protein
MHRVGVVHFMHPTPREIIGGPGRALGIMKAGIDLFAESAA